MITSSRRSIQHPSLDKSDRPDIPGHINNLVDALEIDMIYKQGTKSARLALTHLVGTTFWETDTGLQYYDDGTTWQLINGTGKELDYAQITTSSSSITATTEGTAVAVVTGASVAYDGARLKIETFIPIIANTAASTVTLVILRDSSIVGQAKINLTATSDQKIFNVFTYDTPSAASHTYKASLFVSTSGVIAQAGAGGTGALLPAFIRVSRA